ncbi:MAG: SurA N-terminal domain-containing protein [Phycisphaerales bacterium]
MRVFNSIIAILFIVNLSNTFAADAEKNISASKTTVVHVQKRIVVETKEHAIDPNAVVLIVNGKKLTEGQLAKILAPRLKQINGKPAEDMIPKYKQQMRSQAIEQFIIETMLEEKERAQNITVSEEEVDLQINKQITQQKISEEKFKSVLKDHGIDYSQYREDMKKRLMFEKLIEVEFISKIKQPTNKEIKTYYSENMQQFTKDSVVISYENAKDEIIPLLINKQKEQIVADYINKLKKKAKVKFSNEADRFGIIISK